MPTHPTRSNPVPQVKIACLGYGALVWNPGVLRCVGGWHADGPELPLGSRHVSRHDVHQRELSVDP